MSTKTNIIPAAVLFIVLMLSILSMTACNTHSDWQREAEHTNQLQAHEHGLTQREALNAAVVGETIKSISDNN